eukprot:7385624-Prymnesium_polylepis.2
MRHPSCRVAPSARREHANSGVITTWSTWSAVSSLSCKLLHKKAFVCYVTRCIYNGTQVRRTRHAPTLKAGFPTHC